MNTGERIQSTAVSGDGPRRRARRKRPPTRQENVGGVVTSDQFRSLLMLLVFFIVMEVILVETLFLGTGQITNIHLSTQDYFISDSGALEEGIYLNMKKVVNNRSDDGSVIKQEISKPAVLMEPDYAMRNVVGEETCMRYRNNLEEEDAPALALLGLYQRHSSLFIQLLRKNCRASGDFVFHPKWDNHFPGRDLSNKVLPVVLIRDPYPWMRDICVDRPSELIFEGGRLKHCPKVTDDEGSFEKITLKYPLFRNQTVHSSLPMLWNDWHRPWLDTKNPRLMIRDEDILLHGEKVVTTVCHCLGGKTNEPFRNKAPAHLDKVSKRLEGWDTEELKHAESALDIHLMNAFGYISSDSITEPK